MTQTDTPLSGAEMRGPPATFAGWSSLTPSHAILLHSAARKLAADGGQAVIRGFGADRYGQPLYTLR
jgi:hypothetical protein